MVKDMLNYEDFEEKTLQRREIFKGKIIDVFLDEVALPTGGTAKRELVFHSGAVAMIPLTAEGKIVLVKQFRKPLEQVILEIPAGKIDPGEENQLETTAMRELEEETGYRAGQLTYINSMYLSPGFANEKLALYLATDLQKVENPRPQDEDEILELYELTIAEAKAEVAKGTICDAKTLFAIQYWELYLLQRQFKEDTQ
ncbi:NUDIX hydrolase [Enterococcus faecalis]|nr:NUDIX hydrolase [Enterococcus faecalis]